MERIGRLGDGSWVYDSTPSRLTGHEDVRPALSAALSRIDPAGVNVIEQSVELEAPLGVTRCVETFADDEIFFARRHSRRHYTRFVRREQLAPTTKVAVKLRHDVGIGGYRLRTAYLGPLTPPMPWNADTWEEYEAALTFWGAHALVYDPELVEPDTVTTRSEGFWNPYGREDLRCLVRVRNELDTIALAGTGQIFRIRINEGRQFRTPGGKAIVRPEAIKGLAQYGISLPHSLVGEDAKFYLPYEQVKVFESVLAEHIDRWFERGPRRELYEELCESIPCGGNEPVLSHQDVRRLPIKGGQLRIERISRLRGTPRQPHPDEVIWGGIAFHREFSAVCSRSVFRRLLDCPPECVRIETIVNGHPRLEERREIRRRFDL